MPENQKNSVENFSILTTRCSNIYLMVEIMKILMQANSILAVRHCKGIVIEIMLIPKQPSHT